MSSLEIGAVAPAFRVPNQDESIVDSRHLAGRWVILYFYPKDLTPGCTTEACDFRDRFERLTKAGAVVLGVSKDSARSHRNFREKKELPFDLLSDTDGSLCGLYGVWRMKKFMGRESMGIVRSTFLIGPDGKIKRIWSPVSVKGHVDEVLAAISE
ncbi:MAG TPA: thioredoxin-dependent thiol peroxidase [Fibrobacteria bacterium]|nr:thioredoxin-dependent thiol peroxidase [Fibrobacteria bacterium]